MLLTTVLIGIGGGIGSAWRFWWSSAIANAFGQTFPWGTLIVNITGGFLIGALAGLTGPEGPGFVPLEARLFLMVGICGGFTTFSSFTLQTLSLIQDSEWLRAAGNIAGSVLACLAAVWLGREGVVSLFHLLEG